MAESEKKVCQNCQASFTIDASDFLFYQKIKVPPPTWCPECRFIQRVLWRNEWILYRRKDSCTGEKIFSVFSDTAPVKVYEKKYWWSDNWDAIEYGRDYDWSKPFLAQIKNLLSEVPLPSGAIIEGINSDYCMNYTRLKNCYLVFGASYCENCAYIIWGQYSKDCFDSHMINHSELSYGNLNITRCYRTFFSVNCEDCQDVILSKDCIGCSNCFGCINLRNKSYHIFNQPFTKQDYFEQLQKFNLGSFFNFNGAQKRVYDLWLTHIHKFMNGRKNSNVSGEYISNSKNTLHCYRVNNAEDVKYCQNLLTPSSKDCYDYTNWGENVELMYHSLQCGENSYNVKFCVSSFPANRDLQYSIFCASSANLFGCIGLRNKQYCILNKQYTKEEYEKLVPKIIQHMNKMPYIDKKGRVYKYGEFFPPELSPFCYNETVAQEFFPLTKEQALKQGFSWKDPEERDIKIDIKSEQLPDHIKDVKDDIIGKVIECQHQGKCNEQCTQAFKIIPQELEFYKRMNLPLPRLCPNCRHYQRLKQRNPLKLWHRKCQCAGEKSENGIYKNTIQHFHDKEPCPNEFETSYSPDRPEIVYCEKCYLQEVV